MSDQQNPLSIPELLLQVSEYFESKEAAVPRAVCRAWNEVFSNRVWERCLPSRDTYYMEGALHPPSECLVENAHQLRKLVCNGESFLNYSAIPCTELKKVVVLGFPFELGASPHDQFTTIWRASRNCWLRTTTWNSSIFASILQI